MRGAIYFYFGSPAVTQLLCWGFLRRGSSSVRRARCRLSTVRCRAGVLRKSRYRPAGAPTGCLRLLDIMRTKQQPGAGTCTEARTCASYCGCLPPLCRSCSPPQHAWSGLVHARTSCSGWPTANHLGAALALRRCLRGRHVRSAPRPARPVAHAPAAVLKVSHRGLARRVRVKPRVPSPGHQAAQLFELPRHCCVPRLRPESLNCASL